MKYFNKKIYYISLSALLISISIIFKYISQLIPIFNGYSLDLEIIPFVYGIISLKDYKFKIFFLIICPVLWWFIFPGYIINVLQVFVEYFLVFYIYILLWFVDFVNPSNKKLYIIMFFILLITLTFIRMIIHMIAGIIWWTNNNIFLSFIINLEIIFGNFSINLLVFISTINQIYELNKKYFKNYNIKYKKYYI